MDRMLRRMQTLALLASLTIPLAVIAVPVELYVDSAPNVYGSPDWAPWWSATKSDVVAGTFTNLRTGTYPGTDRISPYDEIVYSTGDLGKRLHWIYWVPGQSTSALDGLFEVKWVIDWDGTDWTYDWDAMSWVLDAATEGWTQPSSWEDYSGGTIGNFGFAWWATDNDALPMDTGGSPYDETDQADIDALAQTVLDYQTHATGFVRYRADANSDWQAGPSIRVNVVPEPAPASLLLAGLALIAVSTRARAGLRA